MSNPITRNQRTNWAVSHRTMDVNQAQQTSINSRNKHTPGRCYRRNMFCGRTLCKVSQTLQALELRHHENANTQYGQGSKCPRLTHQQRSRTGPRVGIIFNHSFQVLDMVRTSALSKPVHAPLDDTANTRADEFDRMHAPQEGVHHDNEAARDKRNVGRTPSTPPARG